MIHDVYLAKVKSVEVKEDWDYEDIVKTIPAAEAYGDAEPRLPDELTCPLGMPSGGVPRGRAGRHTSAVRPSGRPARSTANERET